jgi:hypothetical protein
VDQIVVLHTREFIVVLAVEVAAEQVVILDVTEVHLGVVVDIVILPRRAETTPVLNVISSPQE